MSRLILTHAHFDHIGGREAVLGPGTEVIASAGFPAEAERQRHLSIPFRYLIGTGALPPLPARATWPSRWKSSLRVCSGIPTTAS
jgi:glyoxylase-like metal-dependent hydrolase (beta-lactamase superfamily II)